MPSLDESVCNIVEIYGKYANAQGKLTKDDLKRMMEEQIKNPALKVRQIYIFYFFWSYIDSHWALCKGRRMRLCSAGQDLCRQLWEGHGMRRQEQGWRNHLRWVQKVCGSHDEVLLRAQDGLQRVWSVKRECEMTNATSTVSNKEPFGSE